MPEGKKIITNFLYSRWLFNFILFFSFLSTTYAGNTPCGATNLANNMPDPIEFTNVGNTDSGIEAPPYGGYTGADIWFSFVVPPSGELYLVLEELTMLDPALGIYEGPCDNPKLIYNVLDNNCDGTVSPSIEFDELEPGQEYFIRIWSQNGSGNGSFNLWLTDNVSPIVNFFTFADAVIIGDCIRLTPNSNTQNGCAWFQTEIDFTQPFSHAMTANFGNNEGGADGICLVYQSNGPDYCGDGGGGIGALGMPNSAIFEFDTYQNGNYNDPFQDHSSFNINGDMDHANNIEGPYVLPNIEDGAEHEIVFNWNPAGNNYELIFDGTLILSGSYDIVNNCFGGNPLAWWGYTAGTGALSNEHVICPIYPEFVFGTQSYEEVDLCEGENYNGFTDPGFYVDFESMPNGCQHQNNYLIDVFPVPDPVVIDTFICANDFVIINGQAINNEGETIINTQTNDGCDSVIIVNVDVIDNVLEIQSTGTIDCNNTEVILSYFFDSSMDYVDVTPFWTGPNLVSFQEAVVAELPGYYFLTLEIDYGTYICEINTNFLVEGDTMSPIFDGPYDVNLGCDGGGDIETLEVETNNSTYEFLWTYNSTVVGSDQTLEILGPGIYYVEVVDPNNGCSTISSAEVVTSGDYPVVSLGANNINCANTNSTIIVNSDTDISTYTWYFGGDSISSDPSITVDEAGIYEVVILAQNGCEVTQTVTISVDTFIMPIAIADYTIPCNEDTVSLQTNLANDLVVEWFGPNGYYSDTTLVFFDQEGKYVISLLDTTNQCITTDTFQVVDFGYSPEINLTSSSELNCNNPISTILAEANQTNVSYSWMYNGTEQGQNESLDVGEAGVYIVEVVNEFGCFTLDTIEVIEDFSVPSFTISADTITCDNLSSTVTASIVNGSDFVWTGPNGFSSDQIQFNTAQTGTYIIESAHLLTGCINTDSIEVVSTGEIPEFELSNDTINCLNLNTILDLSVFSTFESISWTGPNGFISDEINPLVSEGGNYYVHIEVSGDCDIDTVLNIFENIDLPLYDVEANTIDCNNPTSTLTVNVFSDYSNILISSPSGEEYNEEEIVVNEPGDYAISMIGTNGCVNNQTLTIEAFLDPPIIALDQSGPITCIEEFSIINANSDENIVNISWDGPNGFQSTTQTVQATEAGQYTVSMTNEYGCSTVESINIEAFLDLPEIELFGNDIDCIQEDAFLSFDSPSNLIGNIWTGPNNQQSIEEQWTVTEEGWYEIQVENEYGCKEIDSIYIDVNVEDPIITLITESILELSPNQTGQINIDIESNANYNIQWIPSTGLSCSNCANPSILKQGVETYEVVVTNEFGCTDERIITIRYLESDAVYIPNIFRPGGLSPGNGSFILYANENIVNIDDMRIYDRWGELIFEAEDILPNQTENGWNGQFKDRPVMQGVYVYFFRVTNINGEEFEFSGDITVVR